MRAFAPPHRRRQVEPRRFDPRIEVVEQAQLDPFCVRREQREIDALAVPGRAQGIRVTRARPHSRPSGRSTSVASGGNFRATEWLWPCCGMPSAGETGSERPPHHRDHRAQQRQPKHQAHPEQDRSTHGDPSGPNRYQSGPWSAKHSMPYVGIPSSFDAVPLRMAIRSASLRPGVFSTKSTSVLVQGNG